MKRFRCLDASSPLDKEIITLFTNILKISYDKHTMDSSPHHFKKKNKFQNYQATSHITNINHNSPIPPLKDQA